MWARGGGGGRKCTCSRRRFAAVVRVVTQKEIVIYFIVGMSKSAVYLCMHVIRIDVWFDSLIPDLLCELRLIKLEMTEQGRVEDTKSVLSREIASKFTN